MPAKAPAKKGSKTMIVIRNIYLYIAALIGLVMLVVGISTIIDTVIANYIFDVPMEVVPGGYDYQAREIAEDMARGIASIVAGFFLWIFHWRIIQKEAKSHKNL